MAQRGAAVLPVDGVMADHPCQAPFVPDARLEPVVLRELLEGAPYEVLAILHCAAGVHPGQPRPQVLPVAIGQVGQLLGVSLLQQP